MSTYTVETDGTKSQVTAYSLAEVANKVRYSGKRIKVWSESGLQLIDTHYGDAYGLIRQ